MRVFSILILFIILFSACSDENKIIQSPDGAIKLQIDTENGLFYSVNYKGEVLLQPSKLGLVFEGNDSLKDFNVLNINTFSIDSTWEQQWGEQHVIRENFNALTLFLQEKEGAKRKLNIEFKVFNDGIGFRYVFPEQPHVDSIILMDELTEFNLANDGQCWWIEAMTKDRYELLYQKNKISSLDTVKNALKMHTPWTAKLDNGFYVSIHEAALIDYASMTLEVQGNSNLKCYLVPWQNGVKVYANKKMETPWRTITITKSAGELIESNLIKNLNAPSAINDLSWIKPSKYIGIWWALHIGKFTFMPSNKHGATTENAIRYIDFAAENGFPRVLIEGWNKGWVKDWVKGVPNSNFTEPFPDFDLDSVYSYARSKGVSIIGHHETTGDIDMYEKQMDSAYRFCQTHGINVIKTGYVGKRLANGEWHYGQFGVRHFQKVIEEAAKYHICVVAHEVVKQTGICRTYPNYFSTESARGMEYNAWRKGGNPPEHTCILPFTRLLAGPMDYTPGIFDVLFNEYRPWNRVNTTLCKQLAYYITIYSPLQMAADLPENYEGHPAFQFIKDVPVNWEQSKVIDAEIGKYLLEVRKDVNSGDWYLGAITNEESRKFDVSLDFLEEGKYEAQIYQDSDKTDLKTAPMEYEIIKKEVTQNSELSLKLAESGGCAIRFKKQ